MTTDRLNRIAIGAAAATLLLLLGAGTSWGLPQGQEGQRQRQLEVFEGLLTDLVQERVTIRVNSTIDLERSGDPDGDGEVDRVALEPVVVKVGRPLAAHGFYLDGYGVVFSIQTPQVAVLPRSFDARLEAPMAFFRTENGVRAEVGLAPRVIDMRADMLMRSVGNLRMLIEREAAAVDADALHELSKFETVLEGIRHSLAPHDDGDEADESDDMEAEAALASAPDATDQARRQYELARARPRLRSDSEAYFRGAIAQQRNLRSVLQRDHQQIANAVNDAAVEALAQYGTVLRGLDSDDRVSVMVLPPNEWNLARHHGVGVDQAEYVISVRYKDIRDYGNEKIDADKFRERVAIHDRLGVEIKLEIDTEGSDEQ